jgi:hypothetical protein
MDFSAKAIGALAHTPQSVAAIGRFQIEAVPVVPYAQPERTLLNAKQDLRLGAARVPDDIVYGFLQYQEELSAHIGIELDILTTRGFEKELNVARSQDIGCKPAHAMGEIAELVTARVDRPNDIAHGLDDFP